MPRQPRGSDRSSPTAKLKSSRRTPTVMGPCTSSHHAPRRTVASERASGERTAATRTAVGSVLNSRRVVSERSATGARCAGERVAYPIGYAVDMSAELLERARQDAGLSQEELAARAGTSRTTISAYERGRKSPTMATASRLLETAGFELTTEPKITFAEVRRPRGRPIFVADRLWRLSISDAFAAATLPLGLNWSRPGAVYQLTDRRQRARCYEIVLREGGPSDLAQWIDGALLVDLWSDLVLPRDVRAAWQPVIDAAVA